MTDLLTAAKQALEALNYLQGIVDTSRGPKAAEALRQAIEQAEKQPPYINFSNDRITVDPNTGNVGIGTPVKQEQAEQVGPTQSPYYMLNPKADQRPFKQAEQHVPETNFGNIEKAEPVAWADMEVRDEDKGLSWTPGYFHKTPLYTHPAREPLTDEQIGLLWNKHGCDGYAPLAFARAIEQAHGIGEKK